MADLDYKTVARALGGLLLVLVGLWSGYMVSRGADERRENSQTSAEQTRQLNDLQWRIVGLETRQQKLIDDAKDHELRLRKQEQRGH